MRTTLTAHGKEVEAAAIVKRITRELGDLAPMLKRDRDADQIRGQIRAARSVLEGVQTQIEERL